MAIGMAIIAMTGCSGEKEHPFAALTAQRQYDAAQLQRGAALFEKNCVSCHGEKGVGKVLPWNVRQADGQYPPPPLDDSAHAWHHPTHLLARVVRDGSLPGQGNMPGWRGKLSEQDITDVVVYVTSLWSDEKYQIWFAQVETPARENAQR